MFPSEKKKISNLKKKYPICQIVHVKAAVSSDKTRNTHFDSNYVKFTQKN